jgi:hypothetical protein
MGRKATYYTFFLLGIALYASAPTLIPQAKRFSCSLSASSSRCTASALTVPAYLADVFGTQFVVAIHGRLLTAWSAAGLMGPFVVNYEAQLR